MTFKRETYLEKPEDGKEYKFSLILQIEYDSVDWIMNVYCRDSVAKSYLSAEKKMKKNQRNFGWELVSKKIPKEWEMIFSQMKDDIFEEINLSFLSSFRKYKMKKVSENR